MCVCVCVVRATDHSCRIAIAGTSVLVYNIEVQQDLRLRPPSTLGFTQYFVTRPGDSVCGVDVILRAADFTLDVSTFGTLSTSDALAESVRTLLCPHCCVFVSLHSPHCGCSHDSECSQWSGRNAASGIKAEQQLQEVQNLRESTSTGVPGKPIFCRSPLD